MSFASFGLPTPILKGIRASGFTDPTAIQSRAIPVILQGNDLIGVTQSGSGKTGAYCIPILGRLIENTGRLTALVLVPTRDLASYVETRARDFARFTNIHMGVVFTGVPIAPQERTLRDQPIDVLVATPGRLLELHARGAVNFEDIEILVLDEADRMVALGLAPDLRKLLKLLPETRQTLMFTVNMPPELNRLAKEALIEPVRVDMAPPAKPSTGITQAVYPVPKELKPDLLDEMLSRAEVRSTVLLCRSRAASERVAKQLQRRGYTVAILDEHPSQGEREQALEDLLRGRIQILVASDASARSLDVTGASHVINFDVPQTPEDYVHRLGRAGRVEAVGDVFTLMSPEEQEGMAAIERLLGRAIPRVMLPDFDYGMHPGELKRVVSYDEQMGPAGALSEGGVAVAATRIAAVPRAGRNGHGVVRGAAKPAAHGSGAARGSAAVRSAAKPAARGSAAVRGAAKPAAHGSGGSGMARAAGSNSKRPASGTRPKANVRAKASPAKKSRPRPSRSMKLARGKSARRPAGRGR
ncbi:MAG TPA: DEAD/DEAH box helicase [Candidatus Eisenbacteria bacterium]